MLGFLEGRHGDGAGACCELRSNHRQAFAGLDVRAQTHAQGVHALLHALDIALHSRHIDERDRGIEGSN
ncbi:hypothetical protein D3C78_1754760 [compost metagenome]